MSETSPVAWQLAEVTSPHLAEPVSVVAAKDIPYVPNANRLQNLSIYLPKTAETLKLLGSPATALPAGSTESALPRYHVHIHGGAWRAPEITSTSIEAAVAHAFSAPDPPAPLAAIASLNYTITKFPTHPTNPYDPAKGDHDDPAREAVHPAHVRDVLSGLALLRALGLGDGSYVLSGHSCGACLAAQATLRAPAHWGLAGLAAPPRPAALLGLNGLYELQALVHGLGAAHAHLAADYATFLGYAFGADQSRWPAASPARFDAAGLAGLVSGGTAPRLVVLDQSARDQLVPMSQVEMLQARLQAVPGLRVVRGHRCEGVHAEPWEGGVMIWESVQDVLGLLAGRT